MRVLVTGSRTWTDLPSVWSELDALLFDHPDMVVVHGDALAGADNLAWQWLAYNGVTEDPYPARWRKLGRGAGMARNVEMVAAGADLCLAFIRECEKPGCDRPKPHGTHGASHCADLAEKAGIETRRIPWGMLDA